VLVRGFGHGDRVGVTFGVLIAVLIAAYTLVDAEGIEFADPVPYLLLILIPTTVAATLITGPGRLRAQFSPRTVLAGCLGFVAYVLVLAAYRLAPAAIVSAVRETSVLFAVVLAAPVLRERVPAWRLVGAALVVAGVAAIALG